jgi:calcineurin-like phosphoesterase family protein
MTLMFSGDSHFGHKAMVTKYRDGFTSLEEMDALLIERWNEVVAPEDELWHLGDVSFYGSNKTIEILRQLNGIKHLIWGNHDHKRRGPWTGLFESVQSYTELKIDGQRIVLCHFPFADWHEAHHGSWHLHGHEHNNMDDDPTLARMDVGADTNDFRPWSYEQIAERMVGRGGPSVGHHRPDEEM